MHHPNAKYITDPAHNRKIPSGHFFRRAIHPILVDAMKGAAQQTADGRNISLAPWLAQFQQVAYGDLLAYHEEGMRTQAQELLHTISRTPRAKSLRSLVRKNFPSRFASIDFSFDLLRFEVLEEIRRAAFALARTTFATAELEARKAVQAAREQLRQGISTGETTRELNARFFQIFADPYKAARIAQTEASNAFHGGQMFAARKSNVVTGLRWLASSDACKEICLPLNGKVVKIGEPFYKHPKPGPYQFVYHPAAHPHCFCAMVSVVSPDAVTDSSIARLNVMAYGPPSSSTGHGGMVFG